MFYRICKTAGNNTATCEEGFIKSIGVWRCISLTARGNIIFAGFAGYKIHESEKHSFKSFVLIGLLLFIITIMVLYLLRPETGFTLPFKSDLKHKKAGKNILLETKSFGFNIFVKFLKKILKKR